MSELKDRITYLRLGLGLTQEQFRDALNAELRASGQQPVSRGAVSNWESGSKGAAMRNLIALSGLTGASIDWLANARGAGPTCPDANTRKWQALFMRQRSEKQDFDRGEKSAIGRIWHAAAVMRDRALDGDLLGGFVAAFSAEERAAIIQRKHDNEAKKFATQIRKGFAERIADLNEELAVKNTQARQRFMVACDELKREFFISHRFAVGLTAS